MSAVLQSATRRLARFVAGRPALVKLAARAFAAFPSLKRRLRQLMAGRAMPPSRRERDMSPDEARVLTDLREALRARKGARR